VTLKIVAHEAQRKKAALSRNYNSLISFQLKFGQTVEFSLYSGEKTFFDIEEIALLERQRTMCLLHLEVIEALREKSGGSSITKRLHTLGYLH
jgi:hypothetical protein